MGSTGLHRERGLSDREFFENEFPNMLGKHGRIIACVTKSASGSEWNRVFYAAVKNIESAPYYPGMTWALVILMQTSTDRTDYCNFYYKDLNETVNPAEDTCPDRILDLLTPTDHENAINWRRRCRAYNAHRAKASTLSHGQIVEFKTPLSFTGDHGRAQRFRYLREGRRTVWMAVDEQNQPRFRCRITNWRDLSYEIVPSEQETA